MARINFVELRGEQLPETKAFYEEAFGWALTDFGPTYACTLTGDVDLGLQGDAEEMAAAPLPVIQVDDLEQAVRDITAAGGRITRPTFAFPGGRRFHFTDPSGNELAAMQPAED